MEKIGFYALFLLLIGAYAYFIVYKPRKKQMETRRKAIESQKRGDRVITVGGMYGQIESIDSDSVVLKVESGALVRVARAAIAGKISEVLPQLNQTTGKSQPQATKK